MDEPGKPCKSRHEHVAPDELSRDAIQRGNEFRVGPIGTRDIDATTLELAEELCRRFKVDAGLVFVKLNFHDGRFEFAWLERRVMKGQLDDV